MNAAMVPRTDLTATLVARRELTPTCYAIHLRVDGPMARPAPGQFVMLEPAQDAGPFWRRALSVAGHAAGPGGEELELMIKAVGAGTTLWREAAVGTPARVLGPLGEGFPIDPAPPAVALVGGGIGLPPLLYAATEVAARKSRPDLYLGAPTSRELIEPERCRQAVAAGGGELVLVTEDGSAGESGLVTAALERRLAEGVGYDAVWACGPMPMLAAVAALAANWDLPSALALEERMACGVGVCLGCIVPTSDGGHLRVCREGPVVTGDRIDWEAL